MFCKKKKKKNKKKKEKERKEGNAHIKNDELKKKVKRKVKGVSQSQAATKSTKISSLLPKRGDRNAKRTENTTPGPPP